MYQEIDFRGTKLDTDSDIRVMAPGDSDHRLNCILDTPNASGTQGNIENDYGFLLQTFAQPSGENEVIGACKDFKRTAIIFFVWNSLGQHQIRRYYAQTGVVELILQSNFLNFQRNYKIYHANVIEDSLSWTDNYQNTSNELDFNSPREISISKARGFTLGQPWPQGYTAIDLQVLEAVHYPPLYSPSQAFVSVANLQSLIVGEYPQFFTRYVYYNFGKSIYSPFSPLNISQNEDGDGNYDFATDNAIDVTFQTGHFTVIKIEVCAKINGAYYLIDILDKYDSSGAVIIPSNSTHTYRYFGDRQLGVLSEDEVLKTQEYLPQVSATQEVVQKNTIVYGNYIEGLATPVTNLSATVKMKKATNTAPLFLLSNYGEHIKYRALALKRLGIYRVGVIYKKVQGYHTPVSTPTGSQVQIPWWADPNTFNTYYDPTDEWILSLNQKPYIEWNLTSTPPIDAVAYEIVLTKDLRDLEKTIPFVQWGAAIGDEDGVYQNDKTSIKIPSTTGYSFEKGDRLRLVAAYNEATDLGLGPVIVAPPAFGIGFYPQTVSETYNGASGIVYDFAIQSFDSENLRINVSGQIEGLEPTGAYLWEIYNPTKKTTASSDGGESGEIFYGVGQTYAINNPGQPNRSHSVTTGIIEGIDVYHRWKKIVWEPQRVKFRVDQIAMQVTATENSSVVLKVGNLVTTSIFKESVSTVASPVIDHLNNTKTSATTSGFKDEKYGTSFNGNWSTFNMYYEPNSAASGAPAGLINNSTIINILSGSLMGQNNQKRLLSIFNAENYVSITSCPTNFTAGNEVGVLDGSQDVFIEFDTRNNPRLSEKEFSFDAYVLCESHSISDFHDSDFDSTGKGYLEDDLQTRKRYPTNLRHGGKFFENTQVNNLFSFDSEDFNDLLVDTYNELTRIRYMGYSLILRQKNKTSAMYIGRTEVLNADGSSNLTTTDGIFGTINPATENWGSYHPGCDVASDINGYYIDATSGIVVRDSVNGQFPISSYKMTAYFRGIAEKLKSEGFEAIGVWDEYINCFVFTLRDIRRKVEGRPDESVTIIFNEPREGESHSPGWKSFMSYVPEWYEAIGNVTVSFKNGELWRHYADPVNTNTYYGTKYPQEISVICNASPNTRKVFTNIHIDSNKSWNAAITIPPTATYPQGMRSELLASQFENLEGGGFFTSFMKDMNTPGFTNAILALVNGRELRGEAIKVLLSNNESNSVYLRQVVIHITPSEQTI